MVILGHCFALLPIINQKKSNVVPFISDIWCSYSVTFAWSTEQFLHLVTAGVDEHVATAGVDEHVAAGGLEFSTRKLASILDSKYEMKGYYLVPNSRRVKTIFWHSFFKNAILMSKCLFNNTWQ